MAFLTAALESLGSAMVDGSGTNASGVSAVSLGVAGFDVASSGSYSKTSGILPSVGEKGGDRGLPGKDMSVDEVEAGDCCLR